MMDKDIGRVTGSRESSQQAVSTEGFDPARIVWSRVDLAIERVGKALDIADYDSGHIITGDNVKISDVRLLLAIATEARRAETTGSVEDEGAETTDD